MKTYICVELEEGDNIRCAEINCAHLVFSGSKILKDRYNLVEKFRQELRQEASQEWQDLANCPEDTMVTLLIGSKSGNYLKSERFGRGFLSSVTKQWFDDNGNKLDNQGNLPLFWAKLQ